MQNTRLFNAAIDIDDAVTKKHLHNADTALGAQTENLDMNTHKITGVIDPTANQEVATKKYVDDNAGGGGLANVVEDTTPQLGGNLDMNGHNVGGNTEAQLDDAVAQKHAESHTIASHSDTTATGAELEELTNGSETTLHSHTGGGSLWTDAGTYYYPNNNTTFKVYDSGHANGHFDFADNFSGWATLLTENYDAFRVDVGAYGITNEFHGNAHILSAIVGAVNVPNTSVLLHHVAGVSGYAKTADKDTFAVGGYFQGQATANGNGGRVGAWGVNALVEDLNHTKVVLYGTEVDVNVTNADTWAFGVNIVGGSTVQPNGVGRALDISALGVHANPKIKWREGVYIRDGCVDTGIHLGTGAEGNNTSSTNVEFLSRTAGGASRTSDILTSSDGDLWIRNQTNSELMAAFVPNDAVYLYYNGVAKFQTTATGVCYNGSIGACDYVFEDNYGLLTLDELGMFIHKNQQLPNLTLGNGKSIEIDTMRVQLTEKVEEQALYILQLHKRLKILEATK